MARRAKAEAYNSNDIVIGYGEVQAKVQECGRLAWVLPGRGITFCKEEATHFAHRLNQMVQANMKRFDRKLVW